MSTGSLASIARSFAVPYPKSLALALEELFGLVHRQNWSTAFSNGGANTVKKAIKEMLEEARSSGGSSRKSTGTVWLGGRPGRNY